jgi:hypothetical protein
VTDLASLVAMVVFGISTFMYAKIVVGALLQRAIAVFVFTSCVHFFCLRVLES